MERKERRRLPHWMKMQRASGESYIRIKRQVEKNNLHTICTSGNCPNIGECWNSGHATFMILGDICTRSCKFCGTRTGKPLPPDPGEPGKLARSIRLLQLKHCVVTSVDRDDLPDFGASFWAQTISKIKEVNPATTIEVLIPDFKGNEESLDMIINSEAEIISHNLETVRRLTPEIRSVAKYERSRGVLKYISEKGRVVKSGIMLGLGETNTEIIETMQDLLDNGCRILTLGQYLQPSLEHMEVKEYITPEQFREYKKTGLEMGFKFVESGPLVRTSYNAAGLINFLNNS